MPARDLQVFLGRWLRAPARVGAILPSGPALARAMAAPVDLSRPGLVVELGAGTGVVTRALLAHGVAPHRLVVVERDGAFCRLLTARFPGVKVLHDDARHLRHTLAENGVDQVSAIVSSLPLLSLSFASQRAILRQSATLLADGGPFVQFTYAPVSPVHPVLQRRLGLRGRTVARVWRNLPPAVVWCYRPARGRRPAYRPLAA
jgi:phosphatidylethanolamine/phosphatidyl-N-methylethanolamine N-methyltransferase